MTFFKGSRYEHVGEVEATDASGRVVRYKRTRFIDDPPIVGTHVVREGDRLDRLAFQSYGDADSWWLIADAAAVVRPDAVLGRPGTVIRMPGGRR